MTGSSRRSFLGLATLAPFAVPAAVRAAASKALLIGAKATIGSAMSSDSAPIFSIRNEGGRPIITFHGDFALANSSDLSALSPKDAASATAVVSPTAAVAPITNPTLTGVASVTSAAPGLSPPVSLVGLGAADFSSSDSVVAKDGRDAPAREGSSLLNSAMPEGTAAFSPAEVA